MKIIGRMLSLVKPLIGWMAVAVISGTFGHLCAIAIPILGGVALLSALGVISLSIQLVFIVMIVCGVMRGVFAYLEQQRNHYIAFKLLALIRDKVFTALRKLCPAKLEGKNRGNLISIITSDIELIEVFYAHTISPIIIATLVSAVMIAFMWQFHIVLALTAFLAYVSVGVVMPIILSKTAHKLFVMQREKFGGLSDYYMDSLRGIKDISHANAGEKRSERIEKITKELGAMTKEISNHEGKVAAISDTLVYVFSGLVLFECFLLFENVSFVYVLLPVIAMLSSFGPVLAVSRLSTGLSRMMAAAERVLKLIDEKPEVQDVIQGKTPGFDGVSVKNLSFSYDEEEILKNFALEFEKDQIVGIYGKSGSGKSTLLKLMMRFWNSPKNSVKISQIDVGEIETSYLRKIESYMTQDSDIFHSTIEENIKVANLNATREQVIEAAKKASIHEFIMTLPDGYDTQVGELGSTISGGERQRIGLARAFLHEAPFLLLDEPTSNLDSLNEGIILKALREEKDKTVLIVSHRKSTLGICDKSIEMENGRLS